MPVEFVFVQCQTVVGGFGEHPQSTIFLKKCGIVVVDGVIGAIGAVAEGIPCCDGFSALVVGEADVLAAVGSAWLMVAAAFYKCLIVTPVVCSHGSEPFLPLFEACLTVVCLVGIF